LIKYIVKKTYFIQTDCQYTIQSVNMNHKDFMKIQSNARKHIKEKLYLKKEKKKLKDEKKQLKKKNKFLKTVVHELTEMNEQMKQELNIALNTPRKVEQIKEIVYVENSENMMMAFLLSVITFGFLKCMMFLQNNVRDGGKNIQSKYDIDTIAYSMLTLHILYFCIYFQCKYSKS